MRAITSLPPPAEYGTTSVIGRAGYSSAPRTICANKITRSAAARASRLAMLILRVVLIRRRRLAHSQKCKTAGLVMRTGG